MGAPVLVTTRPMTAEVTHTALRGEVDSRATARARRNIFGTVDPTAVRQFVDDVHNRQLKEARSRWNFDFAMGVPVSGPGLKWEKVNSNRLRVVENTSKVTKKTPSSRSSKSMKTAPCSAPRRLITDYYAEVSPATLLSYQQQKHEKTSLERVKSSPATLHTAGVSHFANVQTLSSVLDMTILPSTSDIVMQDQDSSPQPSRRPTSPPALSRR